MRRRGCRQEEVLSSHDKGPYRVLGQIVVRTQDPIFRIAGQPIPLSQRVPNSLAQQALRRGLVIQQSKLLLDLREDRLSFLLPELGYLRGAKRGRLSRWS